MNDLKEKKVFDKDSEIIVKIIIEKLLINSIYSSERKNEEESLNKIISQYKNNKIENLYKNKKDFYPFNNDEKKPNKIPHEKLRKNSKKEF